MPVGNTFAQVYTGNALYKYGFRHKTCYLFKDFYPHLCVKDQNFAAFLGLVAGELSSSDDQNQTGITKQGNTFLRKLLVECAQSFSRASSGKSEALKKRQEGNAPEVIAYADRANERLRKRYMRLVLHNRKNHNKATVAIARELACFIWGMMTGNIHTVLA